MRLAVREAIRDGIAEAMRSDHRVFIMGEDVAEYEGSYKVTVGLLKEFGSSRVIDTPISEMGFTGLAVGASMAGLRPIVEFMRMDFSLQAIDHIISTAAKTRYMSGGMFECPIIFRGPNSSAARVGAQHSQCLASIYAHIPGLVVVCPYSSSSAKGLIKAAIASDDPVVFLEHELLYGETFEMDDQEYRIGEAAILRQGSDVTLVSFSRPLKFCLEAATELDKSGISCEVIDLQTLRPLDIRTILKSLSKTKRVALVEEGWPYSGISSEIMAQINEHGWDYLDERPLRLCALDAPLPYAANLEHECLPSTKKIIELVKSLFD